jgi:hypothetical protein
MSNLGVAAVDLSADRQEHRYLLAPEQTQEFAQALNRQLAHHRFRGASANTLPRPQHFVTTVYFDTPSRHAYRALRAGSVREPLAKLRAREYYDLHPSLAELATDSRHLVRHSPGLWLELKFRDGNRTGKSRLAIPRRYVPELLSSLTGPVPRLEPNDDYDYDNDAQTPAPTPVWDEAVMREIQSFCRRFPEPLRADCLVHYRRLPWQDPEGSCSPLRPTCGAAIGPWCAICWDPRDVGSNERSWS